jgi:hypothetical protein
VVGKDLRWRNGKSCTSQKSYATLWFTTFFIYGRFDDKIFDSRDFIELILEESICSIVTSEYISVVVVVGKNLR